MASKLTIRKAQVHVPYTCAWCDSEHDVNWYCNDCQEALCDKCKETHQRARRTRNDEVVPIKQANKQGEAVLPEVCKVHPGKTCDLFCTECNVAICLMCFTSNHKQHAFKHFEYEINTQKHYMREQLETLKYKLVQFNEKLSNRQKDSTTFKESVDIICKDVKEQGTKLKAEIDSIVDNVLAELSSLVAEEDKLLQQDCEHDDKSVKQIKQLVEEVEQQSGNPSSETLLELTGRLRTTIPLHDVTGTSVLPRPLSFETGQINTDQLKNMIGYVQTGSKKDSTPKCEKKEINNQHVRKLTTFQTPQNKSICPIDDTYAWVSRFDCLDLLRVNKKGNVTETVKLDLTLEY
ncbi:tripartite motif-containing protein 45-like [Pecten maximus]|uniref:tripartite motif-containing protein 45-like n=1 Tax=Pecten maximus TaxID=6579 RepID=UPI0014588371|nr:tripartite motif-containing protein 45-like [Pecten maximus]